MKVRQFIFLFLFAAVFSFAQDRNNAKKDFLKYVLEYSIVTDEIKDVAKEIETVGLEKGILKKWALLTKETESVRNILQKENGN
jgi:hypothetical protein